MSLCGNTRQCIDAVVTAMYAAKWMTLSQLGTGKKNGGTKENQKCRFDVMDPQPRKCNGTRRWRAIIER
jgi:hypothetical protein